jgi:arabinofuranosyltransferase
MGQSQFGLEQLRYFPVMKSYALQCAGLANTNIMTAKTNAWIALIIPLYIAVLTLNSWASDDAFITLRVISNLLHGFGPNWNIVERVQVFTHPLWLITLIPFYILTRNPFVTLYITCIVFSTGTVLILFKKILGAAWTMPIAAALILASKSFMDYSSSGLENPLSHFLITLFIWQFLCTNSSEGPNIFLLSLIISLSMLNRLDTILIFLPALMLIIWQSIEEFQKKWMGFILGFLPSLAWQVFSVFYYGFPFPNTYYAKLTTGIPQPDLYRQGWLYYQNSIQWDHITIPFIALALVLVFFRGEVKRKTLAIGIILYLLYILYIGGDFMSGRFFSIPFIGALGLVLSLPVKADPKIGAAISFALTCSILLAGITSARPSLLIKPTPPKSGIISEAGIADERIVYFSCCGLLNQFLYDRVPVKIMESALQARHNGTRLVIRESIGVFGFYAGPNIYIMDTVCLSDPLRARLPVTGEWRIGHFPRPYPAGYEESVLSGAVSQIQNPNLHEYYEKLQLVTRGPLFSVERMKTIINFNLGIYDPLLESYSTSTGHEK